MNLVVKDIDFLPQRIKLAREKKRQRMIIVVASVFLVVLAGLAIWIPFKMEKDYQAKARALDAKINELNQAAPVYNQMITKQKDYDQKNQALDTLAKNNFKVLPFLEKLSGVFPPGAYISDLAITADEGASITYISPGPVETAAIIVGLRSLDIFEAVDIEAVPFMGESKPVKLNLRFKWAKEKPAEDRNKETKKEPDKGDDINAAVKEAERKIKPQ